MRLLFTDTDSLMVEVNGEDDIYKIMLANKSDFDFSNYPFEHENYSECNKRVPGKFKDECAGALIFEWIGIRAKCYSIRQISKVKNNIWTKLGEYVDNKALKGIQEAVKDKELTHEDYRDCIHEGETKKAEIRAFRTKDHRVFTILQRKTALAYFDDKRYLHADGITSHPYGYQD